MTRRRRHGVGAVVLLVAISLLTGCGSANKNDEVVRAFIVRTQNAARRFSYSDVSSARRVAVDGVVEDALRYKARLTLDGAPTWDEVASDDVLVDRFLQPGVIRAFTRAQDGSSAGIGSGAVSGPLEAADPTVLAALQANRWVRDETGAPSLFPRANERHYAGDDPLYDSLTLLRNAELLSREVFVQKFSRENFDYRESEDPFPKPAANSSIKRYDFIPPALPRPNQGVSGNPSLGNFRKFSVYVQNGLVVEIREKIDVAARLRDLERIYNVHFKGNTTAAEQVDIAVSALNDLNKSAGADPIVVRSRVLRIERASGVTVDLPTDTTAGSLSFLVDRGRPRTSKTPTTVTPTTTGA